MIKLNKEIVPFKTFPDGTLNLLNVGRNLHYWGVGLPKENSVVFEWDFENVAEQVVLYNLVKHVRNRGFRNLHLILPYIPNARMDRVHDVQHEVHTLKYFAEFLNDLNFRAVYVLDPHSDVSCTLINNVTTLSRTELFHWTISESKPDIIFYPDAGSQKRYSSDADNLPFMFGEKDRDWASGNINGLTIKNPLGLDPDKFSEQKVLISDDISSKGGTFYHAGLELRKMGFTQIDLFITHCEQSIYGGKLFTEESPIDHIYTTESIFTAKEGTEDKVTVFTLDKLKGEIYNELL